MTKLFTFLPRAFPDVADPLTGAEFPSLVHVLLPVRLLPVCVTEPQQRGSSVGTFRPALIVVALTLLGLVSLSSTVWASPIFIDDFRVTKNGTLIFDDPFSDGVPPPSAPDFTNGTPASYFVSGTLTESGGKVRLDPVGAAIGPGIGINQNFFLERAILLTNVDPLNLTLGLKNVDTFSVRGLFDLSVPSQRLEAYGIRFNDGTSTNDAEDLLEVAVRRGPDGIDRVQFFNLDAVANTATLLGSFLLDPKHDQILLDLTRASAGSNAITASFAYVDGGVVGPFTTFGSTANIFSDENFTRAEFIWFAPVPEPSSLILFGVGFAALAAVRWKRNRPH